MLISVAKSRNEAAGYFDGSRDNVCAGNVLRVSNTITLAVLGEHLLAVVGDDSVTVLTIACLACACVSGCGWTAQGGRLEKRRGCRCGLSQCVPLPNGEAPIAAQWRVHHPAALSAVRALMSCTRR
jgi:hypothetical protein